MSEGFEKLTEEIRNTSRQPLDTDYAKKWIQKMEFLTSISAQNHAAILLHDTSVNRFLFMSDKMKVMGNYHPEDFTSEVGVDFSFSNIPAEQRSAALLIQLKTISYGLEHPYECLNNIVANMSFQYKKKGGGLFQMLQKSMVVAVDSHGYPLLYLRYLFDVSHLLRPSAGLIINGIDETLIWSYDKQNKNLQQSNLLSTQEKKILALLAEAKQSKEIADELFISSHTIDTHRRNLLKKTNCIDTTALITFAKMTGLI